MQNFAMIRNIMNNGMDDDWVQKLSGTDLHAAAHQKEIEKYSKPEKMLYVFLTINVSMKMEYIH